jgi:hypothetical protein
MIVYLANKSQFREDILSNRIEEIVHDLSRTVPPSSFDSHPHYALTFPKIGKAIEQR